MKLSKKEERKFLEYVQDILSTEQVAEMKNYIQHGNTTTLTHCLTVAYYSYMTALKLPFAFDLKSIVRGAMLHDFYLYDWHIPDKKHRFHGYIHPFIASKNARKYFKLNSIEIDIIERHMWPLTLRKVPNRREVLLVCLVDKYCSLAETFYLTKISRHVQHYCENI